MILTLVSWKREIGSVSEKAFLRKAFPNFVFVELPQKKRRFNTQQLTRFLSTGVVTVSSHALWWVLSDKVIWVLGHCCVHTRRIHTSEWDSLFFQSCLLSIVMVTPCDSDYVNRSASMQWIQCDFIRLSRRSPVRFFTCVLRGTRAPGSSRTKSLETVATRVVTGISHRIVCFCERYWLAGVGGRGCARINTNLVVVMFMLRVMT